MFHLSHVLGIFLFLNSAISVPLNSSESYENEDAVTEPANDTQNLYVIRSVVYEIGILTDGDDDPDIGNETREQVDVSFFDPKHNGSIIDLSNIPIPIQTNVSGVSITGILPTDFGKINLDENGTATINDSSFPIFPNKQIKVTHNISTTDEEKSSSILSGLPEILGLDEVLKPTPDPKEQGVPDQNKEFSVDPLVSDPVKVAR